MTRTQLQLDDDTYEALRIKAHEEHKSMSAVVREILRDNLGLEKQTDITTAAFSFISSGASGRSEISVRHDEALAEDFR